MSKLNITVLTFALQFVLSLALHAGEGAGTPTVIHGGANFSRSGSDLTVNTSGRNTIIQWDHFNVPGGSHTRFNQPDAASATLNRVYGDMPSRVDGLLSSNGQVYLVNPRGVTVGPDGVIRADGGFVASSYDISNQDFLRGNTADRYFRSVPGGSGNVVNQGYIQSAKGDVFLIGTQVANSGTVSGPYGTVGFAAAGDGAVVIHPVGGVEGRISVIAGASSFDGTGVHNAGLVEAAAAELRSHGDAYRLAVNNTGVIEARGVSTDASGRVFLTGIGADGEAAGEVANYGTVLALSHDGSGGSAYITGEKVTLASGSVVDVSAEQGSGGVARIGGEYQGGINLSAEELQNALPSASYVIVEDGALVWANAVGAGDGGNIVIWADQQTDFHGEVTAMGGKYSGNGGFAEVSGKVTLNFDGFSNLGALAEGGQNGLLLLDPSDLVISDGSSLSTTLTTNSVVIITGTGSGAGSITIGGNITWSGDTELRILAHGNIIINENISILNREGAGAVTLVAGWDGWTLKPSNANVGGAHTQDSSLENLTVPSSRADLTNTTMDWFGDNTYGGTIELKGGASVGSKGGDTQIFGYNVILEGVGTSQNTQIGYLLDETGVVTGNIGVYAKNNVQLTGGSGAYAQIGHQLQSGGTDDANITVLAGKDISLIGGSSSARIGHEAQSGSIRLQGAAINIDGTVSSGGGLSVHAAGDVTIGSDGKLKVTGAGKDISLHTTAGVTINGTVSAAGMFNVNASGDVTIGSGGELNASNLHLNGANINIGGTVFSKYELVVGAGAAGDVTIGSDGKLTSTNTDVFLDGAAINIGGIVSAARRLEVDASGTVTIGSDGKLTSTNTDISLKGAGMTIDGIVSAANLLGVEASGTVTIGSSGRLTADADTKNALLLIAGKLVNNNTSTASGSIALEATGTGGRWLVSLTGTDAMSSTLGGIAGTWREYNEAATISISFSGFTVLDVLNDDNGNGIVIDGEAPTLNLAINGSAGMTYGDALPSFDWKSGASGLVFGDDVNTLLSDLNIIQKINGNEFVGILDAGGYALTATGTSAKASLFGYTLVFTPKTLTVSPREIKVAVANASRHYGDPDPVFSWLYLSDSDSLLTGHSLDVSVTSSAGQYDNAGGYYTLTGSNPTIIGTNAGNYTVTISPTPGVLTVTPRPITVTADDQVKFYLEENPTLTYTIASGLVGGDTASGLLDTEATATSEAGYYSITQGTLEFGPNYSVQFIPGVLTVTGGSSTGNTDNNENTGNTENTENNENGFIYDTKPLPPDFSDIELETLFPDATGDSGGVEGEDGNLGLSTLDSVGGGEQTSLADTVFLADVFVGSGLESAMDVGNFFGDMVELRDKTDPDSIGIALAAAETFEWLYATERMFQALDDIIASLPEDLADILRIYRDSIMESIQPQAILAMKHLRSISTSLKTLESTPEAERDGMALAAVNGRASAVYRISDAIWLSLARLDTAANTMKATHQDKKTMTMADLLAGVAKKDGDLKEMVALADARRDGVFLENTKKQLQGGATMSLNGAASQDSAE